MSNSNSLFAPQRSNDQHWLCLSDFMTGFVIVFLFVAIAFMSITPPDNVTQDTPKSEHYIQVHLKNSNNLLQQLVLDGKNGVNTISNTILATTVQVKNVLSQGAQNVAQNIILVTDQLKSISHAVLDNTDKIQQQLGSTVDQLSSEVSAIKKEVIDSSRVVTSAIVDANSSLKFETTAARDDMVNRIDEIQKSVTATIEGQFDGFDEPPANELTSVLSSVADNLS